MSLFKNQNFYTVHGWMINVLDLDKVDLVVFAIIYGFSQTHGNMFTGSCQYLADATNMCKSSIYRSLEQLTKKKYINKYSITNNDGHFIHYAANLELINELVKKYETNTKNCIKIAKIEPEQPVLKLDEPVLKLDEPVLNLDEPVLNLDEPVLNLDESVLKCDTIIYNNIDNNIDNNKVINLSDSHSDIFPKNFSFQNSTNSKNSTLKFSALSKNEINDQLSRAIERGGETTLTSVSELVGETLCDIDNTLAKQNRMAKQLKKANELTLEEKQNLRIKKARMKEAELRTSDTELLSALDNFIESYQFTHNKLSKQAWKLILDELFDYSVSTDLMVKYINHSIASGYRKIYPCSNTNSRHFDNTRGRKVEKALHEMTEEEREKFDESLARDENGNLIVF